MNAEGYNPPRRRDRGDPAAIALHRLMTIPLPRPEGVRYLVWRPGCRKPQAFLGFPALMRALHRWRAGRPIQLADTCLSIATPPGAPAAPHGFETLPGVTVTAGGPGRAPERLGFVWLNGNGSITLQAALQRGG